MERTYGTFRTEDFLRPMQPQEKREFERLFPLRGKDVRVQHEFLYEKYEKIWHIELTDVWDLALGRSETAFLDTGVIMYQIQLTIGTGPALAVYLKTPKMTIFSENAEHVLLGAIKKFLTDEDTREIVDSDVIYIPARL